MTIRNFELMQAKPGTNISLSPHRRFNPLKNEWVLVSPQRNLRPWQGKSETPNTVEKPPHDTSCYLCAGNKRIGGAANPEYRGTYVFPNDFPALLPDGIGPASTDNPLFVSTPVRGTAKVICFSERHDLTMARLPVAGIRDVVETWIEQTALLAKDYRWVAIFENKGEAMGCSNPHPHGQIWASDFLPNEITTEDKTQAAYLQHHGRVLLLDYVPEEMERQDRVVVENQSWIAVVPYWAVWPFETLLVPKRHVPRMLDLTVPEKADLADILKRLTTRYDNLFKTDFPYSMGWHSAPFTDRSNEHWQLHAHFYPPLLRSASVKKFMVGYEMLSEPQRDMTAESAAKVLRELSETHFRPTNEGH